MNSWRIWVDTGGTFTDCLAYSPNGSLLRAKVLSSSALRGRIVEQLDDRTLRIDEQWHAPENFIKGFRFRLLDQIDSADLHVEQFLPDKNLLTLSAPLLQAAALNAAFEVQSAEEAPILAARLVTGTPANVPLPAIEMRLATTRGTNALLERNGARTALFITEGFADLLRIGTQQRPELFALEIHKPEPYYHSVVEVPERLDAHGRIIRALELKNVTSQMPALRQQGVTSVAIALMHSYLNPSHEKQLAAALEQAGFEFITCSSAIAPFIKILPRAETTVINAYLGPVIHRYLANVQKAIQQGTLHVMTSAGGLVQPHNYQAKDSLLSGPAGGVVGAARSAQRSGSEQIIAFDMGGTSTDACRFDGDFEYVFEHQVGDAHLVAPALAIESVAAGGGSICWFDGQRTRVGPESAGAIPGPACYGAGGPLSITDVNLLLGHLQAEQFEIPINIQHAEAATQKLLQKIHARTGSALQKEALLTGFLAIANERMADAIRSISVRQGYNPSEYALLAFGGAGGQHACAIADLLDMATIIFPTDASLLSAYGIGQARIERFATRQVLQSLSTCQPHLRQWCDQLAEEAAASVMNEGIAPSEIELRRTIIHVRFTGQESSIAIDIDDFDSIQRFFLRKYQSIYGYLPETRQIEVESLRVIVSQKQPEPPSVTKSVEEKDASAAGQQTAFFDNGWQTVPVYHRQNLNAGAFLAGPALVFEQHSTLVVAPGWRVHIDAAGSIILKKLAREVEI